MTGALERADLEQLLRDNLFGESPRESPERVVRLLLDEAKERGATDNLTAALILVE